MLCIGHRPFWSAPVAGVQRGAGGLRIPAHQQGYRPRDGRCTREGSHLSIFHSAERLSGRRAAAGHSARGGGEGLSGEEHCRSTFLRWYVPRKDVKRVHGSSMLGPTKILARLGRRRVAVAVLVWLAVIVAAAPASGGGHAATEPEGIVFVGEHVRLTAYFLHGAVRIVFSDGQERMLPQVVAASGARYSDGYVT